MNVHLSMCIIIYTWYAYQSVRLLVTEYAIHPPAKLISRNKRYRQARLVVMPDDDDDGHSNADFYGSKKN